MRAWTTQAHAGAGALDALVAGDACDSVVAAIVGAAGLRLDAGCGARRQAPAAGQQGSAGRWPASC
jgi:1-deoxy-D-xylulose 5-phosphate reductoisomerase